MSGDRGYVFAWNQHRHTLRRPPQCIQRIDQPVNPSAFNFTRIKPLERLFAFRFLESSSLLSKEQPPFQGSIPVLMDSNTRLELMPLNGESDSTDSTTHANGTQPPPDDFLLVNNAPLAIGHTLLLPDLHALRHQRMSRYSLALSVAFLRSSGSPCAHCSAPLMLMIYFSFSLILFDLLYLLVRVFVVLLVGFSTSSTTACAATPL